MPGRCSMAVWTNIMKKTLSADDREELLARITEAHNTVSDLASQLRNRCSPKASVVKNAVKAERAVYQLKRELLEFDFGAAPEGEALPEVRRGGKVVDMEQLPRGTVRHDDP